MAPHATRRLLLLGGTTEAAGLARELVGRTMIERRGLEVVTSLAGRTSAPAPLPGDVRVGGFGGTDGLARYLVEHDIDLLVDATHPFAAIMRFHAADAADAVGIPRLRLERPGWTSGPGDDWRRVSDLAAAAVEASTFDRVFLTTGRHELEPFASGPARSPWFLVRAIDPPDPMPLAAAEVILDRGPFTVDAETDLMQRHGIQALVTKDSGGDATAAKLTAARRLGLPVIIVDRPPSPPGHRATTVGDALSWIDAQVSVPG